MSYLLLQQHEVRAFLRGGKTQIRRPLKNQPLDICTPATWKMATRTEPPSPPLFLDREEGKPYRVRVPEDCPYGVPGDVLWGKEAWYGWIAGDAFAIAYKAGGGDPMGVNSPRPGFNPDHPCFYAGDGKWRPSSTMPTWASRLRFVIEEVGVEHVRHISVKDVEAEALSVLIGPSLCTECADGTSFKTSVVVDPYSSWRDRFDDALVSSFHTLWHDTHRRMGYPDPNKLWVWALTVRLEQDDAGE